MPQFNFGIRIGAENDTSAGIGGAMSEFREFARSVSKPITVPLKLAMAGLRGARGALGVIRDLRLGLGGLAATVDDVIGAGLKFEPTLKSFEKLTGTSGNKALSLAKSLIAASHGTLTLSRAMEIANRSLASGLGIGQLGTVLDFVSKKAVSTGKDAGAAIDTVVTGLSRGSTLFLDDFGVLVDGIGGVKRKFDAIKGVGAFDALGPAAQKAEIINQALAEMRQQIGRIGVKGNEAYFVWENIKNTIRSSNEQLLAAVAKSGALKSALEGVQTVVKGIATHFEKGGGIADLLFGKKGGKSGGALGLGGAVLLDLGKFLGKGFMGIVLKGFVKLLTTIDGWIGGIKTTVLPAISSTLVTAADKAGKKFAKALEPVTNLIGKFFDFLGNLSGSQSSNSGGTGVSKPKVLRKGHPLDNPLEAVDMLLGPPPGFEWTQREPLSKTIGRTLGIKIPDDVYPSGESKSPWSALSGIFAPFAKALQVEKSNQPAAPSDDSNRGILNSIEGWTGSIVDAFREWSRGHVIKKLDRSADNLLKSAVGFNDVRDWWKNFRSDFPSDTVKPPKQEKPKELIKADDAIPYTRREVQQRRRALQIIDHDIARRERGDLGVRQEARRRANERIAGLKEQGRAVRPSDVRRIRKEEFDAVVKEATAELREKRKKASKDYWEAEFPRTDRPRGVKVERSQPAIVAGLIAKAIGSVEDMLKEAKAQTALVKQQTERHEQVSTMIAHLMSAIDGAASELGAQRRRLAAVRRS